MGQILESLRAAVITATGGLPDGRSGGGKTTLLHVCQQNFAR